MTPAPQVRLFALVNKELIPRAPEYDAQAVAASGIALPDPDVLLLFAREWGDFLMYRYDRDGECGGDSWHPNLEDAKAVAKDEYGNAVGSWDAVPQDVGDMKSFVVARARGK